MTSDGLGEMFEGDSAHVDGGPSGGSSMRRPGSEDPYRRERKFSLSLLHLNLDLKVGEKIKLYFVSISYTYTMYRCINVWLNLISNSLHFQLMWYRRRCFTPVFSLLQFYFLG